MKIVSFFILLFFVSSCERATETVTNQDASQLDLASRSSFDAAWEICRPCSEGNASFRLHKVGGGVSDIDFTPTCGTVTQCIDDGSGTLCAQAKIRIVITGSVMAWSPSTCTISLPLGGDYTIRQYSVGTCQTNGFDWNSNSTYCPSTPSGSVYIKSQVYPTCTPYTTNSTCIDIDPQ